MKTLIVSATKLELAPLFESYDFTAVHSFLYEYQGLHLLVSGIGMMETALRLQHVLHQHNFDFVLQVGIAGSFTKSIAIGDVVEVISEQYGDLGAETAEQSFLTVHDIGLELPTHFEEGRIVNQTHYPTLQAVSSITVNSVSGAVETINERLSRFQVELENMEGLAVFRVCKQLGVQFSEVRAISNYVEPRDRSKWNISKAVENLNQFVKDKFELS